MLEHEFLEPWLNSDLRPTQSAYQSLDGVDSAIYVLNIQEEIRRAKRDSREIKIHVYSIRQTANVSGEFLRIENKQLKKVQNDSCGQNYHKTTYFCVEAINGKRKIGGKLGHVVQIHVCRLA